MRTRSVYHKEPMRQGRDEEEKTGRKGMRRTRGHQSNYGENKQPGAEKARPRRESNAKEPPRENQTWWGTKVNQRSKADSQRGKRTGREQKQDRTRGMRIRTHCPKNQQARTRSGEPARISSGSKKPRPC